MGRGTRHYRTGTHNYIAQPDHGYQGYADDYLREADYEGEFEPNRDYHSVDESGRSVSSEGVIADHNPFNSIQEALQHKLVNMVGQKSQDKL